MKKRYKVLGAAFVMTATITIPVFAGTWVQDLARPANQGGISNWWYRNDDGSYPTNGWLQINNQWYCFDSVGYMRTGWVQAGDGNYYYCDLTNGNMVTNTWTPDGYYVNESGIWVKGKTR